MNVWWLIRYTRSKGRGSASKKKLKRIEANKNHRMQSVHGQMSPSAFQGYYWYIYKILPKLTSSWDGRHQMLSSWLLWAPNALATYSHLTNLRTRCYTYIWWFIDLTATKAEICTAYIHYINYLSFKGSRILTTIEKCKICWLRCWQVLGIGNGDLVTWNKGETEVIGMFYICQMTLVLLKKLHVCLFLPFQYRKKHGFTFQSKFAIWNVLQQANYLLLR